MSRNDRDKAGGHALRHPTRLDCLCCPATTKHDVLKTRGIEKRRAIAEHLTITDRHGVRP